ncbi:MAG: hypothetical protein AAFZ07_13225 [Actinomycetota bacterium]
MSDTDTLDDERTGPSLARFVQAAIQQLDDTFRFGAEVDLDDPDPDAWDASELIQWASHQADAELPDGSWRQYKHLHGEGATIDVDEALDRPGTLLFRFSDDPFEVDGRPRISHVAISAGGGVVIEATTGSDRVVRLHEHDGRFTHAAEIPAFAGQELDVDDVTALLMGEPVASVEAGDDEPVADDPIEDDGEVVVDQSDPLPPEEPAVQRVDSDGDGISDDMERADGLDPNDVDSDGDGLVDSIDFTLSKIGSNLRERLDTDGDGLFDDAERLHGTDIGKADTDGDGIADALEVLIGTDPLAVDLPDEAAPEGGSEQGSEDLHRGFGAVRNALRQRRDELDEREALEELIESEFDDDELLDPADDEVDEDVDPDGLIEPDFDGEDELSEDVTDVELIEPDFDGEDVLGSDVELMEPDFDGEDVLGSDVELMEPDFDEVDELSEDVTDVELMEPDFDAPLLPEIPELIELDLPTVPAAIIEPPPAVAEPELAPVDGPSEAASEPEPVDLDLDPA